MIPFSEAFTSLQGEGPRAGRVVTFIRLGGCNLSCSWCDTPETWDGKRFNLREVIPPKDPRWIADHVPGSINEVVITGGEPLIHQKTEAWAALLRLLHVRGMFICVETNGTIAPNEVTQTYVRHYSISPKLANAGEHRGKQDPKLAKWPSGIIHQRDASACLKFVCQNELDVKIAGDLAYDYGWPLDSVWVMPEGTTAEKLAESWPVIANAAVNERVNASHRLHVLAWGNRRGT